MRRIVCAHASTALPLLAVMVRRQSTQGGSAAAGVAKESGKASDAPAAALAPADAPRDAPAGADGGARSSAGEAYQFPTNEVMDAVKKRDFNAVQTHATRLVQSRWKEEYNVPAACVVIFVVMWYWIAWSRRSIRRKCEAMKASMQQQTGEMVETVRGMTEKWKGDMAKANQQMQRIIDKNSELTRDIDRMTTALRSCSIRPTPASSNTSVPTVAVVRRSSMEEPAESAPTEANANAEAPAAVAENSKE